MSARTFFDTNVLVYTDDRDSPGKRARALALYEQARRQSSGVVSTQVLQEYFVAATRKLGVGSATARRKVELMARFDVVLTDTPDILAAIDLHRLHHIAFWDALIIRAAQRGRCAVLLSENMQHARDIVGLRIVNPFAGL
jgi:predicted nucleic acid-binding protein